MHLITIYIPVFRRPRSLELNLKRIVNRTDLSQNYIKFLIVDGDNDEKITKRNKKVLEDLGLDYEYQNSTYHNASHTFNKAINSITTPFTLRLEDDQYCIAKNKNWLKDAIKLLLKFDEITLISGEGFEHYGGLKLYDHYIFTKYADKKYIKTVEIEGIKGRLLNKNCKELWPLWQVPFSHGPNIIRTNIWKKIGLYPNQTNQNECENWLQKQFVNNDNFDNRQNARLYNDYKYKAHLDEPFALHGVQLFHGQELVHGNGWPTGISHGAHGKGDIANYIDINSDYCLGKDTWKGMFINNKILEFSPYIDKTGKIITNENFDKYGNTT